MDNRGPKVFPLENKVNFLKKEIMSLRDIFGEEYQKRLSSLNNNGLIFLKREKDKVTKTLNYILNLRPLSKSVKGNSKFNNKFGKVLKRTLDDLMELNNLLEGEVDTIKAISSNEDNLTLQDNLDNLRLALKCFKSLNIRRGLELNFSRDNDE